MTESDLLVESTEVTGLTMEAVVELLGPEVAPWFTPEVVVVLAVAPEVVEVGAVWVLAAGVAVVEEWPMVVE